MVEVLALATNLFLGGGVGLPTGGDLLLSDRGIGVFGGGAVPFLFSDGFAIAVAFVIAVAVLLSFLFSRPLSLGGVALCCVISI